MIRRISLVTEELQGDEDLSEILNIDGHEGEVVENVLVWTSFLVIFKKR